VSFQSFSAHPCCELDEITRWAGVSIWSLFRFVSFRFPSGGGEIVTILNVELHAGTLRNLGEPKVQIFPLAVFEIHGVVAVVDVSDFIEQEELALGVELVLLAAVRQQLVEVLEQVAMPAGSDESRGCFSHHSMASRKRKNNEEISTSE